jgi:peptidoglycan hydrolase-like amidase
MIRSTRQLEMKAGESATFTIGFKNVGGKTWTNEGKNFVSLYTYDPKYRKSAFADTTWLGTTQPARLKEAKAAPGNIATFTFTLFAPPEPGDYHETFQLAAEDLAWIPGGRFSVDIAVTPKGLASGRSSKTVGFKAMKMLVSESQLSLDTGTSKEFRVAFKNVGRTSWTKSGSSPLVLRIFKDMPFFFHHASWSNDVATGLSTDEVKPGQLAFFTFTLSAPPLGGRYVPKFTLAVGDEAVEGGEVEIPMDVRQGNVPAVTPSSGTSEYALSGARGPNIRVGLLTTTQPLVLSANGAYALYDGNENKISELSGVTTATFDPPSKTYTVTNGSFSFTGRKYVRFAPVDPMSTVFEIQSLENRPTWDRTVNFNRFRGSIEYYNVLSTGRTWVTEELPLEDYMRGIAETTNVSAFEFQKALVTAARTYALFVHSIGGKHKNEFFDLNTTGNDQVYKGYVSELVRPNVVRAVEETRGTVVTYAGELAVTPYFSNSDGRTRAWTEVWGGGTKPWLVSKPAPYDQGKTLWGHGVGMSAADAVNRANNGAAWTDILQYYYTGIELRSFY